MQSPAIPWLLIASTEGLNGAWLSDHIVAGSRQQEQQVTARQKAQTLCDLTPKSKKQHDFHILSVKGVTKVTQFQSEEASPHLSNRMVKTIG